MNIRKPTDYTTLFTALDAAVAAQLPQMELYCEIGKAVCAHSEKGAAVAAAEFIKEQYPDMTGFSPRNVRRMRDFYRMYGDTPELLAAAMRLNWTQNVVIMEAELTMDERCWYIRKAAESGLSKTELLRMIERAEHSEIALGESVDTCYTVENDEFSEKNRYEEYPVYLPRQYLQINHGRECFYAQGKNARPFRSVFDRQFCNKYRGDWESTSQRNSEQAERSGNTTGSAQSEADYVGGL